MGHLSAQNDSLQWHASPNPFQSDVNIQMDSLNSDTISQVVLYNIQGQVIDTLFQQLVWTGQLTFTYTGSQLNDGVYILSARVNQKAYSLKLIKNGSIGLSELSKNESSIYPNPAQNEIFVEFDPEVLKNLKLTDLRGSVIWEKDKVSSPLRIDMSYLRAGSYLLHFSGDQGLSISRITKL